jgi:uncharacterized membrane protein YfcA
MDIHSVIYLWIGVVFATVIRGFTGFGFALSAVPTLSLFFSPVEVVAVTAMLSLALGLISFRNWWDLRRARTLAPLIVFALVGTMLGASLVSSMSASLFRAAAGLAVMLACIALALSPPASPVHSRTISSAAGLLSGLMNGVLAMPGPPMILFALLTEPDPQRSRAMLMMFFSASALLACSVYTATGIINGQNLSIAVMAIPALWFGDWLGSVLFSKFGTQRYRQVAILTLATMGLLLIAREFI